MDPVPPQASAGREGEEGFAELAEGHGLERTGLVWPFQLVSFGFRVPLDSPPHFFHVGSVLGSYRRARHVGRCQGRLQLCLRDAFEVVQLRQVSADVVVSRVGHPPRGAAGEKVLPPEPISLPATDPLSEPPGGRPGSLVFGPGRRLGRHLEE